MDEHRLNALEQEVKNLKFQSDVQMAQLSDEIEALATEGINDADFQSTAAMPEPFREQFYTETDIKSGASPQIRVWNGSFRTHFGVEYWAPSGDSELFSVTSSGWVVGRREIENAAGDVDVVFRATEASVTSTTHYEANIAKVNYSGGEIYLVELNPGQKTFEPHATVVVESSASPITTLSTATGATEWDLDTKIVETNDAIIEAETAQGRVKIKEGYSGLYEFKLTIKGVIEPSANGRFLAESYIDIVIPGPSQSTLVEWEIAWEETAHSGSPYIENQHTVSKIAFIDVSSGDVLAKAYYDADASPGGDVVITLDNMSVTLIELRGSAT